MMIDENKSELFGYLAEPSVTIECEPKQVISTKGQTVLCSSIAPCNHEEADTRHLLHVADAAHQLFSKVMIWTVDTDVVVLAIAVYQHIGVEEFWISFGTGKNFKYITAHEIVQALVP